MEASANLLVHLLQTGPEVFLIPLHQLATAAGLTAPGFLAEMDYRNVERVFDVNVHGVFRTIQVGCSPGKSLQLIAPIHQLESVLSPDPARLCSPLSCVIQAVVPHMMAQRSGKIATLCSVNSYLVQPFNAPYAVSLPAEYSSAVSP